MADYPMLTELLDLPASRVRVTHYQLVGSRRLNLWLIPKLFAHPDRKAI